MKKCMRHDLVDEHGRLLKERFSAIPASEFLARPSLVIDTVGVYAILIRNAESTLKCMGYDSALDGKLWIVGGYGHVYTGESVGVSSRLLEHLAGTSKESTFRESLISLQAATGTVWEGSEVRYEGYSAEENLSDWLSETALVAFKHCNLVGEVERDILARASSPLNIRDRPPTPFTKFLSGARARYGIPRKKKQSSAATRRSLEEPHLLHSW